MTEFRRPPTAQEAVLSQLRRWILDGNLRPGDAVRQDAIASALEVSSVPVREASCWRGGLARKASSRHYVTKLTMRDIVDSPAASSSKAKPEGRSSQLTESHLEMRQALAISTDALYRRDDRRQQRPHAVGLSSHI